MCAAMAILALLCIVLGLAAPLVVPASGARDTTHGPMIGFGHQGRMPNSGRKRDSLIRAKTSLIT